MRYVVALLVLGFAASFGFADTFTSVGGQSYTKANDGHYYPSAYVLPNGGVLSPNHFEKVKTIPLQFQQPQLFYPYYQTPSNFVYGGCSGGNCSNGVI